MANLFNIEHYTPKKNDEFFFDTNVWIYILIPALSFNQSVPEKYANFWGSIRKNNAKVLTSFVIISEFVNRYLRFQLEKYNKKNKISISYKNFKNKEEYEENYKYILNIVNQIILPNSELVEAPLEIISKDSSIYNYSKNCDINDNYIIEISKYFECFLVSSDKYLTSTCENVNILSSFA